MIIGFNIAKGCNKIVNISQKDLTKEIIWGNPMFTQKTRGRQETLFFQDWIETGLIYLKDILITNGKIDEEFIFNKLKNKHNYFHQMMLFKMALKPYKNILNGVNNIPNMNADFIEPNLYETFKCKSKPYYENILKNIFEAPIFENYWKRTLKLNQTFTFQKTYLQKIKGIKNKKFAAFNYKVLLGNLYTAAKRAKWDSAITGQCLKCHLSATVEHVLFECTEVNIVWNKIAAHIDSNIGLKDVILGINEEETKITNEFVTIIAYCCYKWTLITTEIPFDKFLLRELYEYYNIYSQLNMQKTTMNIRQVYHMLKE